MNVEAESAGPLAPDLREAMALLASQPFVAERKLSRFLRAHPGHPQAALLLGIARRNGGQVVASVEVLAPLARDQAEWAPAHYELGVTLVAARRPQDALASLLRAVRLQADIGQAWRLIADALLELGDPTGADRAYANHLAVATGNPALLPPAAALCEGRFAEAESLLQGHLEQDPEDAAALTMLAEVQARQGDYARAEELLARCLELAPQRTRSRHLYAIALHRQGKTAECLEQLDSLLAEQPRNPLYLNMKANALTEIGDFGPAVEVFATVLADYPRNARIWLAYGDALKTAGRTADSITAYRRSIELAPALGQAYWSLANLKTFRFTGDDVDAIRGQLSREDLHGDDRLHFEFALAKALEDEGDYAESFRHYSAGNRLRRADAPYDPDELTDMVRRHKRLFTADFFARRRGWGSEDTSPIFIVGLPRAGSTLLEQILSSHPAVEATMELFDVHRIARSLADHPAGYPGALAELGADDFRRLGERYLEQTRVQRKSVALHFIDKMPNNWTYLGLIHLMLPAARIIDARRHPMACCFSCFKQHFATGQYFTYGLTDLGRFYRDYVELMAHFDEVLPGRIHRVIHEQLVDDTEGEIRRLLAYCGLPFEESCLRFYETERAVNTPSSEQVRRPIFREGMDQWRHYEAWLGPLAEALGPVLEAYPDTPRQPTGAAAG